jgi:hypothetical protein
MNSDQFTAIVRQAQVRFGCTEDQAERLAKAFAAEVGNGLRVTRVSSETGLATLRFPDGVSWTAMTAAIRLVRLLQHIEAMDKNIGLCVAGRIGLTPEMDSWLRKAPETPTEPAERVKDNHGYGGNSSVRTGGFRRCRFCRRPAMAGSDVCYTCKSD